MRKLSNWIAAIAVGVIATLTSRIEAQTAGATIACDKQEVRYSPLDSSYGERIMLATINDFSGQPSTKKRSPQGTRYVLLESAGFSGPGPWTTTALIGGVGLNGRLLKLSFINHASGGVRVQWLNEKLLFVEVWWGRIASTDLILDVSSKTFLYRETADYGDMIQPCD
jgi:hypothetical protein